MGWISCSTTTRSIFCWRLCRKLHFRSGEGWSCEKRNCGFFWPQNFFIASLRLSITRLRWWVDIASTGRSNKKVRLLELLTQEALNWNWFCGNCDNLLPIRFRLAVFGKNSEVARWATRRFPAWLRGELPSSIWNGEPEGDWGSATRQAIKGWGWKLSRKRRPTRTGDKLRGK